MRETKWPEDGCTALEKKKIKNHLEHGSIHDWKYSATV